MTSFVLITGCDSGFGSFLADRLLRNHPLIGVIACYHTKEGLAKGPIAPDRCFKHLVDVTCDKSVDTLRSAVKSWLAAKKNASLQAIVNNAGGLLVSGPIEWSPTSLDEAQINLNFIGTVRITKAFLSNIRANRGRVINVSSILGFVGSPFGASYAASKFAVEGWTDALRREMLPFGVRVSLIEPGFFGGTEFYNRYTAPVEEGWHRLDNIVQSAYGEHYRDYVTMRLVKLYKALGTADPQWVINCMEDAIINSRPKHRYRAGLDCIILARILQWIPVQLADLILTVADVVVAMDLTMWPKMPSKSLGSNWTCIVWFAIGGYDFPWLSLIVFTVILTYLAYLIM
jgi:NAD(P)-dependent dehydrogenase (short-subunit alcohol dehydrogenase family)